MNDTLTLEGTLLTASAEERTVTYRLLPYTTATGTSLGRLTASERCITLPDDPSAVVLNDRHIRSRTLGRAVALDWTPDALVASFTVDATPAGDSLLEEIDLHRAGKGHGVELRASASVEVDRPVIRAGHLVGGLLTQVGAVVRGAFPGSTLLASDTPDAPDHGTLPEDDEDEDATEDDDETPAEAPAEEDTTEADTTEDDDETEHDVNDTLTAAAAPAGIGRPAPRDNRSSVEEAVRHLASAFREGGQERLTAALSDIGATTGVGANLMPPAWISELWAGRTYQRRYVPLVTNVALKGMTLKGWKWGVKPAVATYAGNKAAVTSNTPTTSAVSVSAQRLAGAHDVDRAYRDFEVTEFWESYYRAMTDSYAALSDAACLTDLLAAATAPAAPGSGLSTWTPAASIIDGALAIINANGTPTAAVVGADLYRALLLTPQQNMIELLSGGLGWTDTQASGFSIIPSASAALTGKALVLDKAGFVFAELPGSPIRVEAINQANAGIDPGVFGYFADYAIDPLLVQLISKPTA